MSQALAVDSRSVAMELHALLADLDPSRWDGSLAAARDRIARIARGLAGVLNNAPSDPDAAQRTVVERINELVELLRDPPADHLDTPEQRSAWAGYRAQLGHAYEALSLSLEQWSVDVPSLRPTNYTRSSFHLLTAAVLVVLVELVLSPRSLWLIPLCFASFFWCLEGLRRYNARARNFLLWIFSGIAHPHERYRVNSSTWYTTALTILGLTFEPMLCAVALAVMGVADPAAALVGRRYGRTKLLNGRTLEGSMAFVITGCAAALGVLLLWHSELGMLPIVAIAAGATVPAAITELLSRRVDDNLSVPLAAASGGWLMLQLLH